MRWEFNDNPQPSFLIPIYRIVHVTLLLLFHRAHTRINTQLRSSFLGRLFVSGFNCAMRSLVNRSKGVVRPVGDETLGSPRIINAGSQDIQANPFRERWVARSKMYIYFGSRDELSSRANQQRYEVVGISGLKEREGRTANNNQIHFTQAPIPGKHRTL